jgi:hypothetical protein
LFRPDPTIAFVDATRERVVALVESLNQPQISIPSKPSQAAHGFLCGLRTSSGALSLYVGLYLPQSVENVIYVYEPRELGLDAFRAARTEGLQFLESMGFMLDDLRFTNQNPEQQERTLKRVPIFSRPASSPASKTQSPANESALARLLASF